MDNDMLDGDEWFVEWMVGEWLEEEEEEEEEVVAVEEEA